MLLPKSYGDSWFSFFPRVISLQYAYLLFPYLFLRRKKNLKSENEKSYKTEKQKLVWVVEYVRMFLRSTEDCSSKLKGCRLKEQVLKEYEQGRKVESWKES